MTRKLLILLVLLLAVLQTVWSGVSAPVFAQSVDTAWVRRYNGLGNGSDKGNSLAIDDSGNVYVTGQSYGGVTSDDYVTIKYYPNGDTAWLRRYNGPENSGEWTYAIAVDDSENVYVTGRSWTDNDYLTIKYYRNRDTAWVRKYNGPGNLIDYGLDIAVDDSGYVYVTGRSNGGGTSMDYATIKYKPNGDTAWVRRYNGPGNSYDAGLRIAVDDFDNVLVTGYSFGSGTDYDYATIKYDSNGNELWVARYDGPGNAADYATAITLDSSGNVYVTGESRGSGTFSDFATIKYYTNGDTAWVRRYNGSENGNDGGLGIAVDHSGSVYVTGGSGSDTMSTWAYSDYATIKYYSNGDSAWVRKYNGPGDSFDTAHKIAVDSCGNTYLTGYSWNGSDYDYATIKYDSSGNERWVKRYNGPGNGDDRAWDLAVFDCGTVYVTGESWGGGSDFDYATIKYVQFLCGDVNKDGVVDISDVVYLMNYLFINGPSPVPILHAGDANCDEVVDVSDVVYLMNYLFVNGPEPCC